VTINAPITGTNSTITNTIGATAATTGSIMSGNATGPNFSTSLTITPTISNTVIKSGDKVVLFSDEGTATLPSTTVIGSTSLVNWTAQIATAHQTDRYGNSITPGDIILVASIVNPTSIAGINITSNSVIDGLLNTSPSATTPQLTTLVSALQNLTTNQQLKTASTQLQPGSNGASQQAAFGSLNQALGAISSHNDQIRLATGESEGLSSGETLNGMGFWAQGFGSIESQGTINGTDGYDANTAGIAFGGDRIIPDTNFRLGASVAYSHTNVSDNGSLSGSGLKVNSYIGTLYGSYQGKPWYVDMDASFGEQFFDSSRYIGFVSQAANGSYDAQQYGLSTESGYPLPIASKTFLTPFVDLAYKYMTQGAYTETGSAANLSVNSSDTYSLRTGLGTKIAGSIDTTSGWTFKPNTSLSWTHEFNAKAPDQTSNFVAAGGGSFVTPGLKIGSEAGDFGLGLDVVSQNEWTTSVKFNYEIRKDYNSETGVLQLRKDF
jgi:outer membrane autotransporter protein